MQGNTQPGGQLPKYSYPPQPQYYQPQVPPQRPKKRKGLGDRDILGLILVFIVVLIFIIAGVAMNTSDDDEPEKRTISIHNMTDEDVSIYVELNEKMDKVVELYPDEDIMYFEQYEDGDRIRVTNTNNNTIYRSVILDGHDIMFFVWEDKINIGEY